MKRLLTALISLTLVPLSAFAISLSEIQTSPQQYIKISEDANAASFMDIDSIKSIRYSPPYCTLQCRILLVSYNRSQIWDCNTTFNYDYDKNFETRFNAHRATNPSSTISQLFDLTLTDLEKDSGVIYSVNNGIIFNFDGIILRDVSPTYAEKVPYNSRIYACADFGFKNCYGINFTTGTK